VPVGLALEAGDDGRVDNTQRVLGRQDTEYRLVRLGLPVHSRQQHGSAVQVELPCGGDPKADGAERHSDKYSGT
jgi:hypothetical protein